MGQSESQLHTVYHYPPVVIETNADDVVSAFNVEYDKCVLGCACAVVVVFQCICFFRILEVSLSDGLEVPDNINPHAS